MLSNQFNYTVFSSHLQYDVTHFNASFTSISHRDCRFHFLRL